MPLAAKSELRFRIAPIAHIAFILLICLPGLLLVACQKENASSPPIPEVEVVEVIQQDVPIVHEWVGTADGLVNATIRAQVTGYLLSQNYKEGDFVKKGQILFEIDPRPFQAALEQAKGELARQEAQYANAKANLNRIKPLAAQNAVSKKDLDDATGAERSTQAAVIAAKAAVENARLNLGFTKITSPINGMAGLAQAQIGNLVGPNQAGELTTVSTINPIKVYYAVTEQAYIDFMKRFSCGSDCLEHERKLEIELFLADGSLYPHKGTFYAIDRQVDVRTGTLRAAALFPNPTDLLRPGLFVRVHVLAGTDKGALLVPQRAVMELQGGFQVAVVHTDNIVQIRPVKVGERVGALWVINEGLMQGERVVAEGIQKVKQGMVVSPKPFALTFTSVPEGSPKSPDQPAAGQR
jgi:membrane fusion protein, multidrug efflux system